MDPRVAEIEARGARRILYRCAYEAKTLAARFPSVALPVARRRGHGVVLNEDTDLLIEGYPRSANSFSVAAFEMAQGGRARVAHHIHAPAHVISAVRSGIPALVLIREPEEAALEMVIARPSRTVRQALRGWIRFYGPLLRFSGDLVVGPFSQVTVDFGTVIRRVNRRFGTSFQEFAHTEESVRACFLAMDGYWRDRVGPGPLLERLVGRPSAFRDRMKDGLRAHLVDKRLAGLRASADNLYRRFVALA